VGVAVLLAVLEVVPVAVRVVVGLMDAVAVAEPVILGVCRGEGVFVCVSVCVAEPV